VLFLVYLKALSKAQALTQLCYLSDWFMCERVCAHTDITVWRKVCQARVNHFKVGRCGHMNAE